jgi:hypothetical protein
MMANALNLRNTLGLDRISELLDGSRVITATKHEVLPDKNAELIAGIVENILFPDTTTPDSDSKGKLATQAYNFTQTYLIMT